MLIRRVEFVLSRGPISRRGIEQRGGARRTLHLTFIFSCPALSLLTNVKRPEDTTLPW